MTLDDPRNDLERRAAAHLAVRGLARGDTADAERACSRAGVEFIALAQGPHRCYGSRRGPGGDHAAYVVVTFGPAGESVTEWRPGA